MNLTKSSISSCLLLVSVYLTFVTGKSEDELSASSIATFTSSPLSSTHKSRRRVDEVDEVTEATTIKTTATVITRATASATALSSQVISSDESSHASTSHSTSSSRVGSFNSRRPRHHRFTRAATAKTERLWDYGVIPYEIESNFSGDHRALFKQAMRHWENFTCIKFIERTHEHPNYIIFTERPCGCCSFVGKRGNGPQAISIGKNCDKFGIVVHELGHVVGFWHEHTRPDRDNHVHVVHKNIMSGQEYNFNKLAEDEVNSLGLRYDFDSIMHYARNTFSKNAYLDTIEPNEDMSSKARPEIGQRLRLSKGDIAQTNLLYRCPSCGRTLQEPTGSLESPFYPHSSPPIDGESCEWRITGTHGERIVLNLTDIDLPDSPGCEKDYLEIRDGYWHKSPLLGKLCGNKQVPEAIISSGYRMLVTYKSTGTLLPKRSYRGFSATYEAQCGGEISNEEGILQSPNFPDDYRPNKDCVWLLTVPETFHVVVKFQSFETENHESCVYDYLEIRDGHLATDPLIGKYCGFRLPADVRSRSNKLSIKFVSDSSVQKGGFSASFSKEADCFDCLDENLFPPEENNTVSVVENACASQNGGCQHICTKKTNGSYQCSCYNGFVLHEDGHRCIESSCTYHITSSTGEMVSPNWPESYPAKKDCAWLLTTTPGHRIALRFSEFDLEPHQECAYDHIAIYDGVSHDSPTLGRFCGSKLPHPQISSINRMYMTFKSDASVQRKGFKAEHRSECGGRLIASNLTAAHIYSHAKFSDSDYSFREDCEWIIEAPVEGQRLRLRFTTFQLEHEENCAYDFVEIYDGENDSADRLGRFCGNAALPPEILSTSEYLFIRFKTDDTITSKGFASAYQAIDARDDDQLIKRGLVQPNFARMKSARHMIQNVNNQANQSGLQTSATNVQPQYQRQSTVNPASANSPVIFYDPRSRPRHLGSHSQLQPQPQPNISANLQQSRLPARQRSVPITFGSSSRIKSIIRHNRPSRHQSSPRHHQSHQIHSRPQHQHQLHHHYHNSRHHYHRQQLHQQNQLNHYHSHHTS